MELPDYAKRYQKFTKELLQTYDRKEAMSLAVGGAFDAIGKIQFSILVKYGLQKQHTIVDVGCGSGRLAFQLREFLTGEYIGTDVVPDLYEYAQEICQRPDWKFQGVTGLTIPAPDECADFVCFFSVFTHLLHEESYKYLEEAKRVVKPGGKIIFSFFEFANPDHWQHFQGTMPDDNPDGVRNYFISRDAIEAWVQHLNLQILEIVDAGQSICVLTKTLPHLDERDLRIANLEAALNRIYDSHGWKALQICYKVRDKMFPVDSKRKKVVKIVWNYFLNLVSRRQSFES